MFHATISERVGGLQLPSDTFRARRGFSVRSEAVDKKAMHTVTLIFADALVDSFMALVWMMKPIEPDCPLEHGRGIWGYRP